MQRSDSLGFCMLCGVLQYAHWRPILRCPCNPNAPKLPNKYVSNLDGPGTPPRPPWHATTLDRQYYAGQSRPGPPTKFLGWGWEPLCSWLYLRRQHNSGFVTFSWEGLSKEFRLFGVDLQKVLQHGFPPLFNYGDSSDHQSSCCPLLDFENGDLIRL